MTRRIEVSRRFSLLPTLLIALAMMACAAAHPAAKAADTDTQATVKEMKVQALVMSMADDYIAALGESVYLLVRSGKLDPKGRWLAQSFLRNGVGASLDIAVGPNPRVSILDLLVLASLQTWSFETHWIPAGIGPAGGPALERLRRAETYMWDSARAVLSEEQLQTVRGLVTAWIADNPDRTVVALVRFHEFADRRRISSASMRGKATGLLAEVTEVRGSVDEARLLGERLLWLAGRYPYLLGEQVELTAYRLMDQPESLKLLDAVKSARQLSDTLTERVGTIQSDLLKQQESFFARVSAERAETLNQLFDRVARERSRLLDDISSRQGELRGTMKELNETISGAGALARELTEATRAVEALISHLETGPDGKREPLRLTDVRGAAIDAGNAADRLTRLVERARELVESKALDQTISGIVHPADAFVDRIFWRGVILICLLLVGIALLRFVPQRTRREGGPVSGH